MMTRQRANLGFEADLENFDPAEWSVGTPPPSRPDNNDTRRTAEATGFHSREAKRESPTSSDIAPGRAGGTKPRRRRTGRNAQFNLKARPETIEQFCAVADAQGWGLGETLEYAVLLLEEKYGEKKKS